MKVVQTIVTWIVTFVVLIGLIALLAGAFVEKIPSDAAAQERPGGVSVAALGVEPVPVAEVREPVVERFPGSIRPKRETVISPRIIAAVQTIAVRPGAVVDEGDLLVTLDARDLIARKRQAEESVRQAQAALDEAQSSYDRTRRLPAGDVTQLELDRLKAAVENAEAAVAAAQKRVEETDIAVGFARLEAPFAGIVIDRFADPGDTASPGIPLLKMYDPTQLRLEAFVRETLAVTLEPGREVEVELPSVDRRVVATVVEIVPQAEAGSRAFLVKADLPPDDAADLYPGMFGRLRLQAGERTRYLIPASAVSRVGQLEFVRVATADNTVERRLIRTGDLLDGGRVDVLSGLAPGERVVPLR
jgi:membrane fusion protein (multidrug efflux system)